MILNLCIIFTILAIIVNLKIHDLDYMNPACVFPEVFLFSELVCAFNVKQFAISFHLETLVILFTAFCLFSLIGYILKYFKKDKVTDKKVTTIDVDNRYVYILLMLQVLVIVSFVKYLFDITSLYNAKYAFNGEIYGLSNMIKLYDTLTKFWVDTFIEMNVSIPLIYRIFNPICTGCSTLLLYVLVYNYVFGKKINVLHVISIFLLIVIIYLNGSRSPIFRLLTMGIILFYLLRYKVNNENRKEQLNFLLKVLMILLLFGLAMILMMTLIGRNSASIRINEYIFTYLGAPLVNLDNYFAKGVNSHTWLYGAQTFKSFFNYIGKWTGNIELLSYPTINTFTYSNNGIEIGNVYTTFYAWIYDFGYFGILLLLPLAFYYCFSYRYIEINVDLSKNRINFILFLFSYLFNDLIMLFFSNRFYETILDPAFLKMIVFAYIANELIIKRNFLFKLLKSKYFL